jgi:sulfur carrier protein ThiS
MKITVKLYSVLQLGRFKEKQINYPQQSTVEDVIRDLKLPAEHVDILLVNGLHVKRDHVLVDGDSLSVLPMVEGG